MAQIKIQSSDQMPTLRINQFGGVNYSVTPSQLKDNQSADMKNFTLDERGSLNKRLGYESVFASLGPGKINGLFQFGTTFLFAHGTQLYSLDVNENPVSLYTGLADNDVMFFAMNGNCYIKDQANFFVYDGTTVTNVTPYIPTLTISNAPSGGGTPLEDWNLIGRGFKDKFSGNGTDTAYQLSINNLDADTVLATVDGATKTEGTDFTVDRALGKVTFTTAPTTGTNNVEITAYKTQSGFADRIKKCTFYAFFGGANDTRVFVSGNPDYPNQLWRSGLYDPTYWPENGFYKVGSTSEKIQGFSKQYDYLLIEKEHRKFNMQYELVNGEASFPIKPINDQVGTYAPKTIQIIENNPVSLDKTGVYVLLASNVRDERNVQHISEHVDDKLLKEPNLDKALSVDYGRKYMIAINNNVYVYDYTLKEWYMYDNIPANNFYNRDGVLYFGSNTDGILYRFKDATSLQPYRDDTQAINAYWESKLFDFNASEYKKIVQRIYLNMNPDVHTSLNLYIRTDRKGEYLVLTSRLDQFNLNYLDLTKFSLITSDIPQEIAKKIKQKKITHFQIKIENNSLDESLSLKEISIEYGLQSRVK